MSKTTSHTTSQKMPSWATMLWRGMRKRCPRCGAGKLFRRWFELSERCPRCGMKFEREEGFFLGGYLINFAFTEGLLAVILIGLVAALNGDTHVNVTAFAIVGALGAVIAPLLGFPYSRTVWSAIDLTMHPLEPHELEEADEHTKAAKS